MQKQKKKPAPRRNRKFRLDARGFSSRGRRRPMLKHASPRKKAVPEVNAAWIDAGAASESRMQCPKCGSLMVLERFIDYEQTGEPTFNGFRCLSCGLILDPVILINRAQQREKEKPVAARKLLAEVGT
jgi:hypothetical protein